MKPADFSPGEVNISTPKVAAAKRLKNVTDGSLRIKKNSEKMMLR